LSRFINPRNLLGRLRGEALKNARTEIAQLYSRQNRLHPYLQEAFVLLNLGRIKDFVGEAVESHPLRGKFTLNGSDKEDRHSYGEIYESLLANLEKPRILEIGLGSLNSYPYAGLPPGGSLRAFREAYPNAQIVGCDIDPDSVEAVQERSFVLDQTSSESLESFKSKLEKLQQFDLIIDDGFHDIHANLRTLIHLFPLISPEGYYVIEDVHASMLPLWNLFQQYLPGKMTVCDMTNLRTSSDDNIMLIFQRG